VGRDPAARTMARKGGDRWVCGDERTLPVSARTVGQRVGPSVGQRVKIVRCSQSGRGRGDGQAVRWTKASKRHGLGGWVSGRGVVDCNLTST
jgi:hypothetical protein